MACNNRNKETDIIWVVSRAKMVAKLREEDVQIYKYKNFTGQKMYKIEFPLNPDRENIVKIIKWQDQVKE